MYILGTQHTQAWFYYMTYNYVDKFKTKIVWIKFSYSWFYVKVWSRNICHKNFPCEWCQNTAKCYQIYSFTYHRQSTPHYIQKIIVNTHIGMMFLLQLQWVKWSKTSPLIVANILPKGKLKTTPLTYILISYCQITTIVILCDTKIFSIYLYRKHKGN